MGILKEPDEEDFILKVASLSPAGTVWFKNKEITKKYRIGAYPTTSLQVKPERRLIEL